MKNLIYAIAIITILMTLNSCTVDKVETDNSKLIEKSGVEIEPKQPIVVPK